MRPTRKKMIDDIIKMTCKTADYMGELPLTEEWRCLKRLYEELASARDYLRRLER